MQAIGQLHQDHADVVDHRQQHLAEVFRLPLFARRKGDGADLGDALHHVSDFGPEMLLDFFDRRQRVFDDVVEQAGGNCHRIEPHVGQDARHFQRMHQVRLSRMPYLTLVLERRKDVRPAQELALLIRGVAAHALKQVFKSDHFPAKTGKLVSNRSIGSLLTLVIP